jgi:signal recognition particle subunit SRP54
MANALTDKLSHIVKTMRGQARMTEGNTADMLREVRLALLEADVALPAVRELIAKVKEKALGEAVVGNLNPGQALVGVVQQELSRLMGSDLDEKTRNLNLATQPPAVILMAGLQGAGKTTTTGKLAKWLVDRKKKVLTVSADVYRPAAIEQLKTVTAQAGADWFESTAAQKPADIATAALKHAQIQFYDILLVDTAGRLGIDELLMKEIQQLHGLLAPIETFFVVDAMQGQDAVNVAKAFGDALPLTGIVLTKTDGDSRGGAALSVRHITGKPIKFAGVSEKIGGLEAFDAERMAQRILGMGDILSLVEEASAAINVKEAEKLAGKLKSGARFDLEDFKAQITQMKGMGGMAGLMDKLPAHMQQAASKVDPDAAAKRVRRMEGMINSMTAKERAQPELIKATRKKRIATGSGTTVQEVNRMLNEFDQISGMMKKMSGGGMGKMMKAMGKMGGMGGMMGGGAGAGKQNAASGLMARLTGRG